MKILMVFIDMMRPNLLKTWDIRKPESRTDRLLSKWGGVAFTNCYTPAPDTPRSLACLWSGKYPQKNGCDTRIKYPGFYLENQKHTFLHELKNNGYKLTFVMNKVCADLGEIPEEFTDCVVGVTSVNSYTDALNNIEIDDNSLTFVGFDDYHMTINDYNSSPVAAHEAEEKACDILEFIERSLPFEQFDLLMVFSDHGWKMQSEPIISMTDQLNDDRTKVFMYISHKNLSSPFLLEKDKRLCSILDVRKTILNYAGISPTYKDDGISMIGARKRNCLMMEDHRTFEVSINQTIEMWGVRSLNALVCFDASGAVETEGECDETFVGEARNIVIKHGSFFLMNEKAQRLLDNYKRLDEISCYYDGSPRTKGTATPCFRLCDLDYYKKRKVAIFGAGMVGGMIYNQMKKGGVDVVSVYDSNYEALNMKMIDCVIRNPIDLVDNKDYDLVFIAAFDTKSAGKIKRELVNSGIEETKIVWEKPIIDYT